MACHVAKSTIVEARDPRLGKTLREHVSVLHRYNCFLREIQLLMFNRRYALSVQQVNYITPEEDGFNWLFQ